MYSFVIPEELLGELAEIREHLGIRIRQQVILGIKNWIEGYEEDLRVQLSVRSSD